MSIQWDPVCQSGELIQWALHEEAILLEIGQPMLCNNLGRLHLRHCRAKSEATGGLDLLPGGSVISFQPQDAAPHTLYPFIIGCKDLVPLGEEVFLLRPSWER